MVAVAMPMNRDLLVTFDMLRAEGLNASLHFSEGSVEVRLDDQAAVFQSPRDLRKAANWLAECALMHYPDSEFLKVWLFVAKVAAVMVAQNDQTL